MNATTDPNWHSGHLRQLLSSIRPSGSGGELFAFLNHDREGFSN
jgi:hypothetical protein